MKKYIAGFMAMTLVASTVLPTTLYPTAVYATGETIEASPIVVGVRSLSEGESVLGLEPSWEDGMSPASSSAPELRLEILSTQHLATSVEDVVLEFTVSLENAQFKAQTSADGETPVELTDLRAEDFAKLVTILENDGLTDYTVPDVEVKAGNFSKDEVTFTLTTKGEDRSKNLLRAGNIIVIDLPTVLNKTSANSQAIVTVESDDMQIASTDITYAKIIQKGFTPSVRRMGQVAVNESVVLGNRITIKEDVVGSFQAETPAVPETETTQATQRKEATEFTFKLSKGFEFVNVDKFEFSGIRGLPTNISTDEFTIEIETLANGMPVSEFSIENMEIEATTAKAGDIASLRISSQGMTSANLDVAEVVDYTVILSVDDTLDIPVMYSGVDVNSTGLSVSSDTSTSLEIEISETFPGAWSMRDGFDFILPEGVFVADVNVLEVNNLLQDGGYVTTREFKEIMGDAYVNGKYEMFDFKRRSFDDVDHTLATEKASVIFELELVAQPDFEGEVTFGFEGGLIDKQEVVIAEFIKPFEVSAEQNDVIIDYRNTKLDSSITVKETEAGLLREGAEIRFSVDRGDYIQFEKGATFSTDEDSDMEVKGNTDIGKGIISFEVKSESYDLPAEIVINDMELFMQRSIPAGAYDLTLGSSLEDAFLAQDLFGEGKLANKDREDVVGDYDNYDTVVNKAFINVVTAGSDKDNTFTTKVEVTIGSNIMLAGIKEIELDVPAFISEDGYTMLPVRAVSNALGVDTNSVMWDNDTQTVTILYGQRIISMKIGERTFTVNGSKIPSSTAPVLVEGRTFLPIRDLAVALGVIDIYWDNDTRTAILNGGYGVTTNDLDSDVGVVVPDAFEINFSDDEDVDVEA